MGSQRAKWIVLAVLLLTWGAVYAFRQPGEPPLRPAGEPAARPQAPRTSAAQGGGLSRLKVELLEVARAPYPPEGRNIFGTPPPPPPPPRPPESARPASPPPPPPDPFQEEAKQFRYVGYLKREARPTAFLVRGQEVFTVPAGDLLTPRIRVREVTDAEIVLTSPAGDKRLQLPMSSAAPAPAGAASPVPPGPPVGPPARP